MAVEPFDGARRDRVRGICAAVLVFEGLVVFFATLVALDLSDLDHTTLWWVGGLASVACIVLAGLLRRPWALVAGSVLQVLIIGTFLARGRRTVGGDAGAGQQHGGIGRIERDTRDR